MDQKVKKSTDIDLDKYRLRNFARRLVEMGEMEVINEPVALTKVSEMVEGRKEKAILFKDVGPQHHEVAAKVMGNRRRLAAAFGVSVEQTFEELLRRTAQPGTIVEIPSNEAPVHQVVLTGDQIDLTRLPFHPQHEFDGSCYISAGIDYTKDPLTGRSNVGSRRLSLRNRNTTGTNSNS